MNSLTGRPHDSEVKQTKTTAGAVITANDGEDAVTTYSTGGDTWVAGVDESESGRPFKIARTGPLGSGDALVVSDTGTVSIPGDMNVGSLTMNTLNPPKLTTVERGALVAAIGNVIYNTDTKQLNTYNGSEWLSSPKTTEVRAVPPMTDATTTVDGDNWVTTSSSDINTVNTGWMTFDRDPDTRWISAETFSNGLYIGGAGKPGIANPGEWVVMELPRSVLVTAYQTLNGFPDFRTAPTKWHLIYSDDGVNFQSADHRTSAIFEDGVTQRYDLSSPIYTKYIGIQVYEKSVGTPNSANAVGFLDIDFLHEETLITGAVTVAEGVGISGSLNVAGNIRTNANNIALGDSAGSNTQDTIAIGTLSGATYQELNSVAIGTRAGQDFQRQGAVAIGAGAGVYNQGKNSIAIGSSAGSPNQNDNTIIINATGVAVYSTVADTCFVKPIRGEPILTTLKQLYYNTTSGEITYDTA